MPLDISQLKHVHTSGKKTTAQCPVCAAEGADKGGIHLVIWSDGRFGCVVNPGPKGKEHRKAIYAICGYSDEQERKPIGKVRLNIPAMRRPVNEAYLAQLTAKPRRLTGSKGG